MSINGLLNVSTGELCLKNVLQTGQSFRWLLDEATGIYSTTLKISDTLGYSIITLRQDVDFGQVFYEVLNAKVDTETIENHLKNYFRLDVDLQNLHKNHWLANDEKFKMLDHKGIRILGQEPWETLVSFICSTNNNIGRISKMCHALSENFGEYIDEYKGTKYYTFPSSEDIATKATEIQLRGLGFGYRAKYIIETAKKFVEDKKKYGLSDDAQFLNEVVAKKGYLEAREFLMGYCGVGPKVADCVCLMGLHMDEVVPVDVHVGRIAKRDYNIQAPKKFLQELRGQFDHLPITKKKINPELDYIRLKFTEIWGEYAGWAQGLLFFRETDKSDASAAKKRKTTSSPAASKKPKLETNELVSAISVKAE